MRFENRTAAGNMLAEQLAVKYRGRNATVLALPRGGVAVAKPVAQLLAAPLDIVAVRKIAHPGDPELAIGAIGENGAMVLNETAATAIDRMFLDKEAQREQAEAQRRSKLYRKGGRPLSVRGKTAILVDDGIATGLSMRLAIHIVAALGASKIVAAVPIASSETLALLKRMGVDVFVLQPPEEFAGSVGAHYVEFEQLNDAEVVRLLEMRD